jgi:hypothetical protein
MWQAITGAIGGIVSPVATYFTRKAELSEAQHQADLEAVKAQGDRKAALITQGLTADATWEADSLKAGAGWMRNFELYVISIPAILCFFKAGAGIVASGFDALAKTPGWYQTAFLTIYLANYGIRLWRRNQSDT